ncbi:RNA polymerase sigma-70 factor, ECF subfamily [Nocardioides terrae]|uniref:RNA polymerase sigma-70 factor, ECF subfamily n=1 Tax=Nocardioides terrae TaxID=574651 RepID=A0A1I1N5Q2_9ACTN|nr:RNA polymerase sigma factor SigM [Nocardioides terrae]SFC90828.1 RNA polymerase sigma-70 factor, ECF subfamily [Nocardioides terrae]
MSGPSRTDQELLAAHVAGDHDAFGELFARHRDRLWAVALRTMGNPEDAADGLQDALVAAYRRAGSFRGDAAVTTWLHRVVVNACLDRLRASAVRRTGTLADDHDEPLAPAAADAADPAVSAERSEQRRLVLAALARLPAEQRAALVLVDMEAMPVAEAAAVLDIPVGTLKSRCARGRARLAVLLRASGVLPVGRAPAVGGNQDPPPAVPSPDAPARAPPVAD